MNLDVVVRALADAELAVHDHVPTGDVAVVPRAAAVAATATAHQALLTAETTTA